jgi:hypothetical protein
VSPERGQCPEWFAGGNATAGRHSIVGSRAWHRHLGCLILAAGRGSVPAPAVMAGGTATTACIPAVAAHHGMRSDR